MTAATATAADADAGPVRRRTGPPVVRAARLHLVAWQFPALWPWGVLALSFVVNVAIFASVDEARGSWTGGLASIYVVQMIAYVQLFTRGFPFAFAMSVTRRAYYLGSWLYATAVAAVWGAMLVVLRLVEDATDGWGIALRYFGVEPLHQDNLALQYLAFVVPFLLTAGVGAFLGLVVVRWRTNGVLTLVAALVVLSGLTTIVVSRGGWWGAIGGWFADQPAAALSAAWPLPFVVVLGGLGYAVIRRATP